MSPGTVNAAPLAPRTSSWEMIRKDHWTLWGPKDKPVQNDAHSSVNYLGSVNCILDTTRAKDDEGFCLYVSYVLVGGAISHYTSVYLP